MQRAVRVKPGRLNPAIERANRRYIDECNRQADLKIGGAALAMHRKWGYGKKRIETMLGEMLAGWKECGEDESASILMMLEEETGIELQIPGEPSYHEILYLNGTADAGNLTDMQILAMRGRMTKWIGTMFLASVMLSMHRKYGFGADRDTELMNEIAEIEAEFGGSGTKITAALKQETGVEFRSEARI